MLSLQVSQLLQPPTLPETAAAAGSDATGIPLRWRSMEGGVAWFGMRWVELKGRTPILWASCGGSMWNFPMVYGCIWYLPCMYVDEAESVGLGSSCRGWDHIDIFFFINDR